MEINATVINTKGEAYKYIKNSEDVLNIDLVFRDKRVIDFNVHNSKETTLIEDFDIIKNVNMLIGECSDKIIDMTNSKNKALALYIKEFDDRYLLEILKK